MSCSGEDRCLFLAALVGPYARRSAPDQGQAIPTPGHDLHRGRERKLDLMYSRMYSARPGMLSEPALIAPPPTLASPSAPGGSMAPPGRPGRGVAPTGLAAYRPLLTARVISNSITSSRRYRTSPFRPSPKQNRLKPFLLAMLSTVPREHRQRFWISFGDM